jgi:NTE family protein
MRCALATLLEKLPEDLKASEEVRMLRSIADRNVYSIVHLIYRSKLTKATRRTTNFRD